MRRVRRTTTPMLAIDLAPLIDVVFLLLTFFIFATLVMVRADVLGIQLPGVSTATPADSADPIVITVDQTGQILLDQNPVELGALAEAVLALQEASEARRSVLLAIDVASSAGRLIEIADRLNASGVPDFGIIGTPNPADTSETPSQAEGADRSVPEGVGS